MIRPQFILPIDDELIVDNFAGGGGAAMGIEMALGRHVDIAINHDPEAVALHQANHPQTQHHCEDVFKVNPLEVTRGQRVGLAWFSPDCKHFSKAKGGKPRSKKIRGLAWVVVKWAKSFADAGLLPPRVIILENVEEFQDWGPLLPNGRPCPVRKGRTFKLFISKLEALGYVVDWKELRACDYGAPTIRKRLFLVARCDGRPIVWPEPTHRDPALGLRTLSGRKLKPWRTAAECIDWSIPGHSIFLTRREATALRKKTGIKIQRPLAKATMRRLGKGTFKFVLNAAEPFIVSLTHQGGDRVEAIQEPFKTITGAHRGEKALAVPFMTEHANASHHRNFPMDEPFRTQCAEVKSGHFALAQAFLAKHYGGPRESTGSKLNAPVGSITSVDHHSLVATHLTKLYGTTTGQRANEPLHSVTAGGHHLGVVNALLGDFAPGVDRTTKVCAFLLKYYSEGGQDQKITDPMHTITTKDRIGLVTVAGETFAVRDIYLRMLVARELYRGQGFPDSYIIDIEIDVLRGRKGKRKWQRVKLSQEAQVRMCGNSVCPPMAEALVAANVPEMARWQKGERTQCRQAPDLKQVNV